ncbi:PREDICTED: uncharacterized protein LOC109219223 [Nicotiana attenuata]|uniref:uncharacterized protein LOC109219223 n=1 Tax=Nicotiana attenuata TaxID=49451 RepID=UPI000905CD42|nr:PREDICTED: uncharacterized protein LOC109219223 [Nicotiana attenuata]
MAYFSQSLSGATLEWYTRQDASRWYTWDDMAQAFARHFQYNIDIVPNRLSLTKVEKKLGESFREYGFQWREQPARVNPLMEEDEMVECFLQALEPTYFGHLISAIGKSFNDVVKIGEMVEEGPKSSKIMSYFAIKATAQAIQSGSGSLLGKKKKDDVAMVVSGPWNGQRGSPHQYTHPRPRPKTYTQAPHNPRQHYFPPQNPQYSARPPQYHVHHAQSYAQPPAYQQWRAPAPQNTYPPLQPYQNPTGSNFRPRLEYRRERLRQLDVLRPIESKIPNPPPKNLDYSLRCAYCSDAPGHDIEKCWHLKRAIQEIIDTNQIVVQSPDTPNINQNPLPAHAETHMIEIVHKDGEPNKSSKGDREAELAQFEATGVGRERVFERYWGKLGNSKSGSARAPDKPVIVVKGASITPVVIKPVTQLPVLNTKVVPWNYKQVIVTYKGKGVEEEVNKTGGFTRFGRCFTPEELRKDKPFKDSQMPVKKSLTEEEDEEFLKKMKVQDYSNMEQLRKTPAQISLLSLLIHSDEHCRALMKILNEVHVPDKITVHHLEKVASKIFEVNKLSIWPVEFTVEFQVLDVALSYNLLLGRPWIHAHKAVPSSLHQMVSSNGTGRK